VNADVAPPGDRHWLALAVELSRRCPPSATAFSVGAVVVADGREIARGHSRETDAHVHAEEAALAKLDADDERLRRATIYTSLEPCSTRRSRSDTCTQLILRAGIPRVVFAWREPEVFVDCHGAEDLRASGVEVVEMPELADAVRAVNAHLLRPPGPRQI
jgi:diaminohydroxyphosphoribosylaminopyrimidine deaminase/5-amino-6-(5-phosphoribosylamino)uracil reductase